MTVRMRAVHWPRWIIIAAATTDRDGMFAFPNAEGGSYIVEATLLGFTPSEMVVDAGSNAPIAIILAVGTFAQEVTVTALMPELATEMVVPASQIERRVAQDLARSLRSHAGVTALRRGAINLDPSVRGLYAEQIGVFVDGTRTFAAGPVRMDSALSHISPHALQSLRVVRGPYALTWGAGTLSAIQAETFKPAFGGGGFRLGGRVGVNYGSNGSAGDGFAGLWGSSDRVRFTFQHNSRIGSDYTDGDGNRVPGHYESFDTRWNAGVRLGTRTLLEYSGGYQRQNDIDYPGRILDATFFDTQSHALDVSHTPAAGILTELAGQVYLNLKDHLMNNDAKPTAQRNPHRTPPFPIRVDLPTSSDTRGGRFHVALETGPLRYKMGLDAYRLQQSATQTVSDRDTGQIHHTMHPVWPNADQTNLGGYAQVLWDQGRSTIGGTVRIDREQAQIGQVTSFFAHNAIPVYALHEVHGQFHCVTAVCMPQMSHDTGTGHMADTHTGHDAATATMDHGAALDHGATMGHAGYGATMLVSGDRFAQTNTNVSAAANASLRMTDTRPRHLRQARRRLHHRRSRPEPREAVTAQPRHAVPLRPGGRRAVCRLRPDRQLGGGAVDRSARGVVVCQGAGSAVRRAALRHPALRAAVRDRAARSSPHRLGRTAGDEHRRAGAGGDGAPGAGDGGLDDDRPVGGRRGG